MAFISVFDSRDRKGFSGRKITSDSVRFTTYCSKNKKRRQLVLRVSETLAKKARILIGDRVDILFDKKLRIGLIKRVGNDGFKVSSSNSEKDGYVKYAGQSKSFTVSVTSSSATPLFSIKGSEECKGIQVTDEGIIFAIPEMAQFQD